MRGLAVAAIAVLVVAGVVCGDGGARRPAALPSAEPSAMPSTAQASTEAPTLPDDLIPTPLNQAGYPPCGFYTRVQEINGTRTMSLGLGVAIGPFPPNPASNATRQFVTVRFNYDETLPGYTGGTTVDVQFNSTGAISNGNSVSPQGVSFPYVSVLAGSHSLSYYEPRLGRWLLVDPRWEKWFGQVHTVKVTVDPENRILETNEKNNSLTLQVKPTKRSDIQFTDNKCTVVK